MMDLSTVCPGSSYYITVACKTAVVEVNRSFTQAEKSALCTTEIVGQLRSIKQHKNGNIQINYATDARELYQLLSTTFSKTCNFSLT